MPLSFGAEGSPFPRLLQVSAGLVRVSRAAPLPSTSPLSTRITPRSPARGVQPNPPGGDTAQQWRSGQGCRAHPAFPPPSAVLTLLQVLLIVPRLLFLCGEVLHPGCPPHGPWAAGGRCGGAAQGRGAGPGTMRRRWAGSPASRTRATEPRLALRPFAIGRCTAPTRGFSAAAVWFCRGPMEPGTRSGGGTKGGGEGKAGGTAARRVGAGRQV